MALTGSTAAVLNVIVLANTKTATGQLLAFDRKLRGTAANANVTSNKMGTAVTKGAKTGALAIAALGAASVVASAKWESSFAEVRKTVDASEKEFDRLERRLRDLAKMIPIPATELAELAGQAGALGIKAKDLVKFTKDRGRAGDHDRPLGRGRRQRSRPALEHHGDLVEGLPPAGIDDGRAREPGSLDRVRDRRDGAADRRRGADGRADRGRGPQLRLGALIGRDQGRVGGLVDLRAPSSRSPTRSRAGARTSRNSPTSPGPQPRTSPGCSRQDAAGATIAFIEGLGKIDKQGGDLFGTLEDLGLSEIRVRDALLRAAGAGDLFNEQLKIGSKEWERNNALTEEAKKRYDTTSAQFQIMKNRVFDLGITIGDFLEPATDGFLKTLNDLLIGKGSIAEAIEDVIDFAREAEVLKVGACRVACAVAEYAWDGIVRGCPRRGSRTCAGCSRSSAES